MDRRPLRHVVVTLVAQRRPFLDEHELLLVLVVEMAGGALSRCGRVMLELEGFHLPREVVVALEADWFLRPRGDDRESRHAGEKHRQARHQEPLRIHFLSSLRCEIQYRNSRRKYNLSWENAIAVPFPEEMSCCGSREIFI
jgi:hypothetical protein